MKKRIVIAMVTGLVIASFAGCGTQADATNQSPESSSAVESQTEPTESETGSDAESKTESTEPSETTSESGDLEDDNIILYAEKEACYDPIDELEYSDYDGAIHAESVVPLYDGKGNRVGEMKIGGTVYVGEVNMANNWARFKNPIDGTEYEYLYTAASKVKSNNITTLTAKDAEDAVRTALGNEDVYTYTDVTEDMEVYEFLIPISYDETEDPVTSIIHELTVSGDSIFYHSTYAIVCEEDTDGYMNCKVYYKD